MTIEKATLPREVAEAIERARARGKNNASIVASAMTTAKVLGHNIEKTPEDRVLEYYNNMLYANGNTYAEIIAETLDLLGIKITGVNAE
jgi:hypothetical protein